MDVKAAKCHSKASLVWIVINCCSSGQRLCIYYIKPDVSKKSLEQITGLA